MTSTQGTKEQAQQTAATAVDEGKHVASVAGQEAQNVAGQAKDQARGLMDDAISQVDEQTRTQRDRLVGTLQTFSHDLDDMASTGSSGLATQLTQQVADRARHISAHLDGREPSDLLEDVRQYARRRPGIFLLGALGAGVVVGRLAKGAKQAKGDTDASAPTHTSAPAIDAGSDPTSTPEVSAVPSYGQPVIAAPSPPVEPSYSETPGAGTGPQGTLP